MAERWRLFVAADLDDAARAACTGVADRLRTAGFPARWVPPENYHLTVAFLGSADPGLVVGIGTALREVAARVPAFTVPLDTVGAFPRFGAARIAWIGPAEAVPGFATLAGAVREALAALGFSFDPHADAHVTLARAEGRPALPRVTAPPGSKIPVRSIALYRSLTEAAGARYLMLERFPLSP